ncbi:hypothetical protein A0H81_01759 [Grifola frondosa]|uniref:C2H2-type domain-containing protein n=1 Tax=Grifola frondosa TaxID=5627 RepID=A0A1C7MN11_GRIFR|nr:hypothetical protein A0H81_01759 [Grifola frondosa]
MDASDLNFKYTSSSGSSDQFDSPHSRERCVVSMLDAYDRGRYIFPDGNMNTLEIPGNSKTIATQSTILMPASSRPAMRAFERPKQPMFHANQHVAPPGIMQLPPSNEPFVLQNTRYFQPHPGDGPFPYQAGAEFPSQISAPPFINRRLPMPSGSHQNMLTAYSRMPSFTLLHRGALSGDPSAPIPPVPAVLPGRYQQAFYQTGSHIAVPGPTRYAFPMQPPFMDNIPDPAASWSSRPLQKSLSFHPYHKPDTSGSDESHLSDFHMDLWLSGYHLDPSSPTDIVRCRWKDCVAEMEAKDVVNHVMKVHCRNDGSNKIHCLWVKCGKQRQKGSMHGHVQNVHVGLDHVRCKFCGLRTKKTNKSHAKSCLRKVIFYKPIREQVAGWAAPDGASEEIII